MENTQKQKIMKTKLKNAWETMKKPLVKAARATVLISGLAVLGMGCGQGPDEMNLNGNGSDNGTTGIVRKSGSCLEQCTPPKTTISPLGCQHENSNVLYVNNVEYLSYQCGGIDQLSGYGLTNLNVVLMDVKSDGTKQYAEVMVVDSKCKPLAEDKVYPGKDGKQFTVTIDGETVTFTYNVHQLGVDPAKGPWVVSEIRSVCTSDCVPDSFFAPNHDCGALESYTEWYKEGDSKVLSFDNGAHKVDLKVLQITNTVESTSSGVCTDASDSTVFPFDPNRNQTVVLSINNSQTISASGQVSNGIMYDDFMHDCEVVAFDCGSVKINQIWADFNMSPNGACSESNKAVKLTVTLPKK